MRKPAPPFLGLSQVHGFAKQSGGHAEIVSEANVGTMVRLFLPRSAYPAAAEPDASLHKSSKG